MITEMYIILLLLLYIILSQIYFYTNWKDLYKIYKELQIKYESIQGVSTVKSDSKLWCQSIVTEIITGKVFGYFTNKFKPRRYKNRKQLLLKCT